MAIPHDQRLVAMNEDRIFVGRSSRLALVHNGCIRRVAGKLDVAETHLDFGVVLQLLSGTGFPRPPRRCTSAHTCSRHSGRCGPSMQALDLALRRLDAILTVSACSTGDLATRPSA
jgi:hypothetical protein